MIKSRVVILALAVLSFFVLVQRQSTPLRRHSTGGVKSVVVLQSSDDLSGNPVTLSGSSTSSQRVKKKKKVTMLDKPVDSYLRDKAGNLDKATSQYFEAREKSNRKKKNGWIVDLPKNVNKAYGKLGVGSSPFKLPKLF